MHMPEPEERTERADSGESRLCFAFDVYGTLIDVQGVLVELERLLGQELAQRASAMWRQKQLEYSFRRTLMQQYAPFSQCTEEALDWTLRALQQPLGAAARRGLLEAYLRLPAFDDALPCLVRLREQGARVLAFSNGSPEDLQQLLEYSGLLPALDAVVSVHPTRHFKPAPQTYAHFCHSAQSLPAQTRLVSCNAFDILGAERCGWQSVWLARAGAAPIDTWADHDSGTRQSLGSLHELNA